MNFTTCHMSIRLSGQSAHVIQTSTISRCMEMVSSNFWLCNFYSALLRSLFDIKVLHISSKVQVREGSVTINPKWIYSVLVWEKSIVKESTWSMLFSFSNTILVIQNRYNFSLAIQWNVWKTPFYWIFTLF